MNHQSALGFVCFAVLYFVVLEKRTFTYLLKTKGILVMFKKNSGENPSLSVFSMQLSNWLLTKGDRSLTPNTLFVEEFKWAELSGLIGMESVSV